MSRGGIPLSIVLRCQYGGAPGLMQWLLGLVLLVGAAQSTAHRGHAVWTDIHWTEDRFEITHRMHVPDAITVNRFMGGSRPIEHLHSLALVALYVEERFSLVDAKAADAGTANTGAPVVFETLGAEIVDGFVFVYQEWPTPLAGEFPAIDNRLLLDVEPESQAFVRIKGPGIDEERVR